MIKDTADTDVTTNLLHEPFRVDPVLGDLAATADDLHQSVEIVLACQQVDGFEQAGLATVVYAGKEIDP